MSGTRVDGEGSVYQRKDGKYVAQIRVGGTKIYRYAKSEDEALEKLGVAVQLDWGRVSLDGASVSAKRGARPPARIRRIQANQARSPIRWSTGTASRSLSS